MMVFAAIICHFYYCYTEMGLWLCGTAAANWPIVHPPPDDISLNMKQQWNDADRG